MTMHTMDCAALDELLADYLEGDLGPAERREVEAHVASCVRCSALLRDLEAIRSSATELPELTPSRDLWSGIAQRIDTPVIPFAQRPAPNVATRTRNLDRLKRAAIAAALVAVTAGVTYTLTVAQKGGGSANSAIATNRPSTRGTAAPSGTDSAQVETIAPTASESASSPTTKPGSTGPQAQAVNNSPEADTYFREIDRLRTVFTRNRAQLDPRTIAIIETNLKVIDEAIAQSKAALAQDPASRFLNKQLNSALDKKLELLRTAALLPNRT
jgi:putative zinc finger protein